MASGVSTRLFKLYRANGLGHAAALKFAGGAPQVKRHACTIVDGDVILADATSRAPADGVTTINTKIVTSATAAFTAADVGKTISGTGIPGGATIVTVNSGTSVTTSANSTASGTGITITIGGAFTVTLPTATEGAKVTVKCLSANDVTLDPPGSVTIDGAATLVLATQYQAAQLVSDGANWFKVN